jgi:hypothetical protein
MATKKWFRLAAVVAAIGGAVGYVLTKAKENPEKAAELYEGVKETAKESPEKAAALYDAAKDMLQRGNGGNAEADAERETVAS